MTRKEQSLLMWILFIIIIAVIASACGPAYHLKRADRHIQKAIDKGAAIKKDTIRFHFKTPEIRFSTTLQPIWEKHIIKRDTLRYTDPKTGSTIKAVIKQNTNCPDSCNQIEYIYAEAECPPQDQSVDVPCDTVQAGYTGWEMIILAIACLAAGAVLGRLFWRR